MNNPGEFSFKSSDLEIEKILLEVKMLQFSNPRFTEVLDDNYAEGHPTYLNPHFQCSNLECQTCIGLALAREWSEQCYRATHRENTIEESIREYHQILKISKYQKD